MARSPTDGVTEPISAGALRAEVARLREALSDLERQLGAEIVRREQEAEDIHQLLAVVDGSIPADA